MQYGVGDRPEARAGPRALGEAADDHQGGVGRRVRQVPRGAADHGVLAHLDAGEPRPPRAEYVSRLARDLSRSSGG